MKQRIRNSHRPRIPAPIAMIGGFLWILASGAASASPNVILIMTDDQGYGDLGYHDNPVIKTPNLDRFAAESVALERFYVCPVCAPTRASLMTGRYNYRTGVVDTYRGRAMMHSDETTLAEMLSRAGYKTGIFGKWHLGDNYPLRSMDQGFQESLVHRGGGIGQPGDSPGNRYQDPIVYRNGEEVKAKGYCSDVFTDGCVAFVEENRNSPFFAYLSYNCPHTPLQVPDRYWKPYFDRNLTLDLFPKLGYPVEGTFKPEVTAKVYGMVENIDENLGRLFAKLDDLNLSENTLVIFLTDNGPQQPRYIAGLRGRKGSVYEGGIRVPCFVRWPAKIGRGARNGFPLAHIDILPTIAQACGVAAPENIDGRGFLSYLETGAPDGPDRTLFFQWHRGDEPELHRAFAALGPRYKLVQAAGVPEKPFSDEPSFELFDLQEDPYELHDLSEDLPDVVAQLNIEYETWFREVGSGRGYFPPRIYLGTEKENPVTLTRQDWRGSNSTWSDKGQGYWEVEIAKSGVYDVTFRYDELPEETTIGLAISGSVKTLRGAKGSKECRFNDVSLSQGPARLDAWLMVEGDSRGVRYVDVARTGD